MLIQHIPGQAAKDKQQKGALLFEAFQTRSWTAVESLPSQKLREGLALLREKLDGVKQESESATTESDVDLSGPWDDAPGAA